MGDFLGYMRVSTHEQDLQAQRDRLTAAGTIKIFHDIISGKTFERPGLAALFGGWQRNVCIGNMIIADSTVAAIVDMIFRQKVLFVEIPLAAISRGVLSRAPKLWQCDNCCIFGWRRGLKSNGTDPYAKEWRIPKFLSNYR